MRKMILPTIPNRAPTFATLFSDEDDFIRNRSEDFAAPLALNVPTRESSLFQLDAARTTGQLPHGFSMRKLSSEIAKSVRARIVSEHEGLIDILPITIPREDKKTIDPLYKRHYQELFRGLGSWVKYVILCAPIQNDAILKLAQNSGIPKENVKLISSPRFNYSIWAQDAYVALNDSAGGMILCEGISFPRAQDMTIADDVTAQSEISTLQSYLYFQGGNVLCSGERTLIGMDYIQRNIHRYKIPDIHASIEAFEKQFGTTITPIGGKNSGGDYSWYKRGILSGDGFQPIFHIDMYVTPTGVKNDSGKEIIFLGRPSKAYEVSGRYSDIAELNNKKHDSLFLEAEEQLQEYYEVRHLPLWITHGTLGYDDVEPRFYNLTWNNCIVQNGGSEKRVLLPKYSPDSNAYGVDKILREELEGAAEKEWSNLGFSVKWMDGIEDLAFGSGAVHCITKTLKRAQKQNTIFD